MGINYNINSDTNNNGNNNKKICVSKNKFSSKLIKIL